MGLQDTDCEPLWIDQYQILRDVPLHHEQTFAVLDYFPLIFPELGHSVLR